MVDQNNHRPHSRVVASRGCTAFAAHCFPRRRPTPSPVQVSTSRRPARVRARGLSWAASYLCVSMSAIMLRLQFNCPSFLVRYLLFAGEQSQSLAFITSKWNSSSCPTHHSASQYCTSDECWSIEARRVGLGSGSRTDRNSLHLHCPVRYPA